jgi:hypothetical protein
MYVPHALSEGEIKNGKKEGVWISYWENGQINTKGTYTDGKKEGVWEVGAWKVNDGWETCDQDQTKWHASLKEEVRVVDSCRKENYKDGKLID